MGVFVMVAGCVSARDPGSSLDVRRVPTYEAPKEDRCAKFKRGGSAATACDEARYLGQVYVRRLAIGDEVCLEGGFGDPPGGACLARAAVADTGTNLVLLEVRQARPDSRWFQKEQSQFWFQEGALVDLYLADHGY
jgi:hypothetical protein